MTATTPRHCPSTPLAPSSPQIEMAVLGCCQLHPEAYHTAAAIIGNRAVFHEKPMAKIWGLLQRWYTDRPDNHPDGVWFTHELMDDSEASICAAECVNISCLPVNIDYHTGELLRLWKLRRSHDLAGLLARAIDCGDTETTEAVRRDLAALDADADSNTGLVLTNVAAAEEVPIPLFDNGIPPAGFGLVIGADGAGKGFLLADMLLSCALGRPVSIPTLARRGTPLRVLYLSYEDSASILKWRMDRITAAAGMDADVWHTPNLSFLCEPEPLYMQSGHDVPKPTEALHRLRQHITANKIDIVVIDPLSACAVLQNENDNSALNVVACSLRAMAADTGCACILVHHTSKAGRNVSGDHQAARGGSALGGAARWALSLTQSQDDKFLLDASVSKNSYGKRVYDIALSRDPETGVLREVSGAEIGKAKDVLLDAVIQFVADHPSLELNPNAIKARSSEAAKQLIDAVDGKPGAVYDAVTRAVKCGALVLESRQRANRSGTYEVLTVPGYDDEDGIPF